MKVEKFDYTLHPESQKFQKKRASDHVPEWRKKPEAPETDFTHLAKPKPKPKKSQTPKATPASVPSSPASVIDMPVSSDEPPDAFPPDEEIRIVMTDKQSIMS